MDATGERILRASQQRVYALLHDPVVLRQTIPGCQVLNKLAEDRYEATIALKIGPVKASFFGTIVLFNEDPPAGYSLRADAAGGLAGSASGTAHVALASIDAATTNLAYHINADLRGQLGGLEPHVVDAAARTLIAEFFSRLESALGSGAVTHAPSSTTDATGAPIGGTERRPSYDDTLSDETAYTASHYTLAGDPPAPAAAPRSATTGGGFETAPAARVVTSPATTDALGEPLRAGDIAADGNGTLYPGPGYEPTPVMARDPTQPRVDTLPTPRSSRQGSREAAVPSAPEGSRMTIWRWFLVLLGVAAIVALLTGAV